MINSGDMVILGQVITNLTANPNRRISPQEQLAILRIIQELAKADINQQEQLALPTQTQKPSQIMKRGRIQRT